jgi:hypothetical protein
MTTLAFARITALASGNAYTACSEQGNRIPTFAKTTHLYMRKITNKKLRKPKLPQCRNTTII